MSPQPAAVTPELGNSPQAGASPMQAMMQHMMQNPALMQQSMQLAHQMFGAGNGIAGLPGIGMTNMPSFTPPSAGSVEGQTQESTTVANPIAAPTATNPVANPMA